MWPNSATTVLLRSLLLAPVAFSRSVPRSLLLRFRLALSLSLQLGRLVYLSFCPPRYTSRVSLPLPCRFISLPPSLAPVWFSFSLSLFLCRPYALAHRVQHKYYAVGAARQAQLHSAPFRFVAPPTSLRDAFMYTVGNTEATRERECSFIGTLSPSPSPRAADRPGTQRTERRPSTFCG